MIERGTIDRPGDDERDDLYGQDSFPASDPPSTWWGASRIATQPQPPVSVPAAGETADAATGVPPDLP